jgi:hypothetical protein
MSRDYDDFCDAIDEMTLDYMCDECDQPNCDNCPILDKMAERKLKKSEDEDPVFFQDV